MTAPQKEVTAFQHLVLVNVLSTADRARSFLIVKVRTRRLSAHAGHISRVWLRSVFHLWTMVTLGGGLPSNLLVQVFPETIMHGKHLRHVEGQASLRPSHPLLEDGPDDLNSALARGSLSYQCWIISHIAFSSFPPFRV